MEATDATKAAAAALTALSSSSIMTCSWSKNLKEEEILLPTLTSSCSSSMSLSFILNNGNKRTNKKKPKEDDEEEEQEEEEGGDDGNDIDGIETAASSFKADNLKDRLERSRHLQILRQRRYRARKKNTFSALAERSEHLKHTNSQMETQILQFFFFHQADQEQQANV